MGIDTKTTLLIIPPNDEEALLIADLADRVGFQVYRSDQPHGARLEKEKDLFSSIIGSGAKTIVIVEMPGLAVEEKIQEMGKHLVIIDHHNYPDLERAYDPRGHLLPSSLEQFLRVAEIEDVHLRRWGYNPKVVRGIGLWDAGYLWALLDAGYSHEEVEQVITFKDELARRVGTPEMDERTQEVARLAFAGREPFGDAFVVVSPDPTARIRSSISRLFATTYWKPKTLVLSEGNGAHLYVQETTRALDLFHHFGGFTFGSDRNWGYDNEAEKEKVSLGEVKKFLIKEL